MSKPEEKVARKSSLKLHQEVNMKKPETKGNPSPSG